MEFLIFNEQNGLKIVQAGDYTILPGDFMCNTIDRNWFKRRGPTDIALWKSVTINELPARLRTEALILGITL